MKKFEIIIANLFLRRFIESLEQAPVSGFSVLDIIDGKGPHEDRSFDSGLVPVQDKSLIFMIVEDKELEPLKEILKTYIKEFQALVIISDVEVLK